MVKNKTSWIGKPLAKNKPHDFFKTNPKNIPSNMFKDNDKDGVANVFDCKPNNPHDQGLIDAIIGAGKAVFTKGESVTKGWKKGWKSESQEVSPPHQRMSKQQYKKAKLFQQVEHNIAKQDEAAKQRAEKTHIAIPFMKHGIPVGRKATSAFNYAYKRFYQGKPTPIYVKGKIVGYEKGNIIERARRRAQAGTYSPTERRTIKAIKRTFQSSFPIIPKGATTVAYGYQSQKGQQSGRGRPRGSLDPRYAPYGGVMGYRKALSAQRRAFRQQLAQRQEMMRVIRQQQRAGQMPQYEQVQTQQTQQQEQVPQEMQGQGVTPEYSQYQQVVQEEPQQVYQYQQPQMPQQAEQRPIATVFKQGQGKAYTIPERGLAPSNAYSDVIESTDLFSGKRVFIKKLQPEKWSRGY